MQEKYIDSILKVAENLPSNSSFEALQLGMKAYKQAKEAKLAPQMAQSLILAGKKEYEGGNYSLALKHAEESIEIAATLGNYRISSDAHRLKGVILGDLKKYTECKAELHKARILAIGIADEDTKRSRLGVIYNDLAHIFDEGEHNHDSVISYYQKGYREFSKMNLQQPLKDKTRSLAYFNIGAAYLKFHSLDSAKIFLDKAHRTAANVKHHTVEVNALEALGNLHFLEKDYDKSILLYQQAITIAKNNNNLLMLKKLYFSVSLAYDAAEDLENSKKYLNEYMVLADSLESEGYSTDNFFAEKLEILKSREGFARKAFLFILFCVGFLGIVFYIFKENKNAKATLKSKPFEEKVLLSLDEQQKILRSTAQLAEKNDPSFLIVFKKSFPSFFEVLNTYNSTLIASEHKMCALMVLNFSTKEIAQCTKSSVRAIEAKKYRLRKKLGVPSEMDLNLWLIDIFKKHG